MALKDKANAQKENINEIKEEQDRAVKDGKNPAEAIEENSPEKAV